MPSILDLSIESTVPECCWSDSDTSDCDIDQRPPNIFVFDHDECFAQKTGTVSDDDTFDSDIVLFIQNCLIPLQKQFNDSTLKDYNEMTDHERQYWDDSLL